MGGILSVMDGLKVLCMRMGLKVLCVMKTFTWRPFGTFGQGLAFAAPNLGTWMMMMIRGQLIISTSFHATPLTFAVVHFHALIVQVRIAMQLVYF